jgi:hypothetical protein
MCVADENFGSLQHILCKFRPFGGVVGTGLLHWQVFHVDQRVLYVKMLLTKRTRMTGPRDT